MKIEIHLPIFALHLIKRDADHNYQKKNTKEISYHGYFRIIKSALEKINNTEIIVNKVIIPIKSNEFDKSDIIRPLRQHALICAFFAYLRTKTQKLILSDNAIALSPDVDKFHFHAILKLRLYKLIYGLISVSHSINEEKKRARS